MPQWLLEKLQNNPAIALLEKERGTVPLSSLIEEALIISAYHQISGRGILVIKENLYAAQRLYDRISSLLCESDCALFGANESLRVEAIAASPEITANKVDILFSLMQNPNQVVITCPSGILRHLPKKEVFKLGCMHLKTGETMDMEELKRRLRASGYFQTSHIDQPLNFAARGGIVDLYSINYDQPLRIEFFGDEIDSIRFFDISTQKTIGRIEEIDIVPASDILYTDEDVRTVKEQCIKMLEKANDPLLTSEIETDISNLENHITDPKLYCYYPFLNETGGLWEYMDHPLVIYSDPSAVEVSTKHLIEDTTVYIQEMIQEHKMLEKFAMWHDLHRIAPACHSISEDPFMDNVSGIQELHLPNESLSNKLKMLDAGRQVVFCLKESEVSKVSSACIDIQKPYTLMTPDSTLHEGFQIGLDTASQGFSIDAQNLLVATGEELFEIHRHKGRYENKFRNAEILHSYQELEPGDFIVHVQHGIGQYMGIETREVQGNVRDFLKVIYRGNTELLVPLEQFRLVRKFISREGAVPRLSKLGSSEWQAAKQRIQNSVNDLADRLVTLYANREETIGHAFQPDSELEKKFDSEFEYELTPDQKTAVEDIKKDMETNRPMDRLVCGDVGFGKTEVAIRASFKAAAEGFQTAVLCPTTILAEQHFHTFTKRYEGYPVNIRVMDRFVPLALQNQILKEVKAGKVDILIGTHRILSKDIEFKNLGLLIIDEEQRFGVEHKEKIKEMKNGIDVLSLSATPIPRTLQMSLVGVRQMSQLETPPDNRYSVKTYVVEKNQGLVKEAIEKELARNGQVYYMCSSIEQIYQVVRSLQHLMPEVKFGIAHGQMDRDDIEDTMMQFTEHKLDVLVCTTIIENGIDIPNVNTILIDQAQNFGLAQLYQIKGRVGRSNRLAYAYLMIPDRRQLTEVALKRLQAVKEFAKLGSGYKVAMRDLTIRGAGDMLGPEQSGFIDTVGIDMYLEMLSEAIQKRQGKEVEQPKEEVHVNVDSSGYIPEKFAPDDFDKIDMYRQIEKIGTDDKLNEYQNGIEDEYGKLPKEVLNLFNKKRLEISLNDEDIKSYRQIRGRSEITFSESFSDSIDGIKLFEIFNSISKDLEIRYTGNCIIVLLPKMKDSLPMVLEIISRSREAKKPHEN